VVIPCYNYGRFLEGCVQSVLSQEDVDVDVLIIDDASTDDSGDVARSLGARENRIKILRHDTNRGHIATYNEGLMQVSGRYTVLLSADDLLVPGALARAAAIFSSYPTVGLVYGRAVFYNDGTVLPAPDIRTGRHVVWRGPDWLKSRCQVGRVGIASPEAVVRSDLQKALGGYRPDLPHSGDSEMWMRFATQADVAFVDADHAYYRLHPKSMSKSQYGSVLVEARERYRAFEAALGTEHDGPSIGDELMASARKGLAAEVLWGACRAYDRGEADSNTARDVVDFARSIYSDATHLPEYRRLQLRRLAGPRGAAYVAPLWFPDLVLHRVRQAQRFFGPNWVRHLT
jgi:glycosyltransferase involved in cell wall biosynthesis